MTELVIISLPPEHSSHKVFVICLPIQSTKNTTKSTKMPGPVATVPASTGGSRCRSSDGLFWLLSTLGRHMVYVYDGDKALTHTVQINLYKKRGKLPVKLGGRPQERALC